MKFTLAQLRCARLVAEFGSFSEAGRRCGMSQPSISANVSELEGALGAALFRRTTRRVELTAFGRALMPRIAELLVTADDLPREARAILQPERKLLRIAFSPLIDAKRLSALLDPFRRAAPDAEIIFKECDVAGLEARLDQEQIDIACGVNIQEDTARDRCVLYTDWLRYLPRGGRDAYRNGPEVEVADLAGETFILTVGTCGLAPAMRQMFRKSGVALNEYAGQALSYTALQQWSELGIGAAMLPESRIAGDGAGFPRVVANGRPVRLVFEAVWSRTTLAMPHVKQCIGYLRKGIGGQFGGAIVTGRAADN